MRDSFEDEDLVYNLAYECEALFDHLQDTLRKTETSDGIVQVCGEFQQRFAIWAAHLGVFARKSQCLDTRLRNLPDLQDLVARLLDILRHSLQQCTIGQPSQEGNDEIMVDIHEVFPETRIQTAALKTIDDTLTRLNRLGVTIRQSGRGNLETRVERFAAGLDLSSFACLCAEAVQALYPGAHQSLKDRLSRSMTDRYARMLFLDSRNQKLQTRRELPTGLSPIPEVPTSDLRTNTPFPRLAMGIRSSAIKMLSRPSPAYSQSDLSSVNLQQIKSRLRPPDEASTKLHKTSSIQINQGNYPHIPAATQSSGVFTCPWCSELLSKKTLSESEWRRHIDRDLKPYICLSEACPEAHPAYSTFDEWYRHMELHDRRWHQHTYLTSSWVCTICELSSDTYSSPQALYMHLEKSHGTEFTHPQLQAISRQSKTEQPRVLGDCLLCCFAVEAQGDIGEAVFSKRQRGQTKQQASKSARKTLEMAHPSPHDSDSELSDTSPDSDDMGSDQGNERSKSRSKAVSRHVAVHLQVLMLLTLRFAAALHDNDGDVDDGTKSDSVDIDEGNSASDGTDLGRLSHVASEDDVIMKDGIDGGDSEGDVGLDESPSDDFPTDEIPVPDSDINLGFIPRQYDNLAAEDDEFLNELIESGDFSWEENPKGFSISRAIMTATRVALAPVNIIDGINFDFPYDGNGDGDGDGDGSPLTSDIEDHIDDTSHDPITTKQLPDELGKPLRPDSDLLGTKRQGALSTTMGNGSADGEEEDGEGDQTAQVTQQLRSQPVQASKEHSNSIHKANGNGVKAYAKVAAQDWTYYITKLNVNIGRSPEPSHSTPASSNSGQAPIDINLSPSRIVSREHATISFNSKDEIWMLYIKGRNGAKVNGQPIKPQALHPLTSGEVIEIGNVEMMFILPSELSALHIHPMFLQRCRRSINTLKAARPPQDAETSPDKFADTEEDSPPRLKRVGHVQFDEFAQMRTSFPSSSADDNSEGAEEVEEAGDPSIPWPEDETANDDVMTLPRRSAKTEDPSRLPGNPLEVEEEALDVHEDNEENLCTYPDCGRTFKDLEAHMLTHQMEQPERCPIMTCEYHVKGFARKYDRSSHLLNHYKGIMYCDFCPGTGSADQKSFTRVASFKRHLTAVHGVEPRPPPNSRWSSVAYRQRWLASYAPEATGKCSICSQTFTTAQDFYMHLDDCVLRIIRQENLLNFDDNSGEITDLLGEQGPENHTILHP